MRASEGLGKRFIERLQRGAISTAIEVNDAGLVFGAGTVLARMTRNKGGESVLDLNTDRQRIFALLAVAYGRVASPDAFRHIEGASEQWRRGDRALANIRLAFARLPRLEDRASVTRLFHAEDLLERGVSPRALMLVFGFDSVTADLAKYDPNQPRVEALATFASRFTLPTAVLGALIIPSPNDGVTAQGTLPDHPDVNYRLDRPEGMLARGEESFSRSLDAIFERASGASDNAAANGHRRSFAEWRAFNVGNDRDIQGRQSHPSGRRA
ncbi:hypothetical protein MHY1_00972 [Methylovirgula sp. HY1]|nr:hypothetical protein [Methylovirgula sp. HY1]QXX74164.1 hypothetical protein MHY1_00972 [Methylovirgula sp. HY1]